jgi:hypothetical protein
MPSRNRVDIEQGAEEPLPQQAGPHRSRCPVEHGQQRTPRASILRALEKLEGGDGRRIEHEGLAGSQSLETCQVTE